MRSSHSLVAAGLITLGALSIALALIASVARATIGSQVGATATLGPHVAMTQALATGTLPGAKLQPTPAPGAPPIQTVTQSVASGLPIGTAPLSLEMRVGVATADPGAEIQFELAVGSANPANTIQTRSFISGPAEVIGASASGGSCAVGNPVVCKWALNGGSGSATIVARVAADALPGATVSVQTLAQDSSQSTAASSPSAILVAGAAGQPADAADLAQAASPSPTSIITEEEPAPNQVQPTATGAAPTPTGAAPLPTSAAISTASAMASPTTAATATGVPLLPPSATAAEPTTAPAAPTSQPAAPSGQNLPETAALPFAPAVSLGLFGFGLIALGVRRIRAADRQLQSQSNVLRRLSPLVAAVSYLQRRTRNQAEAMEAHSRALADQLHDREP
jgi:hypothetical protein